MLGLLYLFLCFATGYALCSICLPKLSKLTETTFRGTPIKLSKFFILVPAWFVSGTLVMTWTAYIVAYLFRAKENPLKYGDFAAFGLGIIIVALGTLFLILKKRARQLNGALASFSTAELVFVVLVVILVFSLMYKTFFVKEDRLYVGVSVFSDFSPHLGMIRSFSHGNNFPTVYSHYAGEDVRYHFMFQFLVGNLEFLGLRLDHAFNIPSILSLVFAYFLLYALAVRLSGRKPVGYLTCLFFAFRCSPSLWKYLSELPKKTVSETALANTNFIGYTTHEDWGLWNLNVYCNQRHLAIGMCALLLVLHLFIPNIYVMAERWKKYVTDRDERERERKEAAEEARLTALALAESEGETADDPDAEDADYEYEDESELEPSKFEKCIEKIGEFLRFSLFRKEGWMPKDIVTAVVAGILLGMTAFWNGATLLATIMVLFVLAMAADRRLEFLITAVITAGLSLCQTSFFTEGESVVSAKMQYGFIAENPTLFGSIDYVLRLCGVLTLVLLAAFAVVKGVRKWILFAFSAPFIFSFYVSLTMDVTVNHKYIMVSIMLMNIFAAILIDRLFRKKSGWLKAFCVFLVFIMTATGLYDYRVVIKKNNALTGCLTYAMDDPMADWIEENTTSQDIFLTPFYSLSRPVLAGAMLYEGHAYYPMTAGYDTDKRYRLTRDMYECKDRDELIRLLRENNISYVIIDNDARTNDYFTVNEAIFEETFEKVYVEDEGQWMISIFDTSKLK